MEYWRQCSLWLINCKVLPRNHRVTADSAQVFDLAQTLRDGVLLCQLLNNLRPDTINLKEINLRPQMSQFLCLKNIRTFLSACCEAFGMKKSELFDAFDLFDVRDFGKFLLLIAYLLHLNCQIHARLCQKHKKFTNLVGYVCERKHLWPVAQSRLQFLPRSFPTEESSENEDIYIHLADLIDEELEEDIYDPVYGDVEGGEVYEDLMRTEAASSQAKQAEVDIRSCCLLEIKQTEAKYTETLETIEKDLVKVHKSLMTEIQDSVQNKNAENLHQIFITYKDKLLLYGKYCSHVESAISLLDFICKEKEGVRLKLEECSKRANNGKFTLRDLLVVPMQRVLKYPLLLQELVKYSNDTTEKSNLRVALDAMRYVNEVKRDVETLREIDQYQRSIENLNQCLLSYGRPKGDGEVRLVSNVDKRRQDRHIFLFDVAVIVCKRRGDNYEMKEVIDLNHFKITNNPSTDKDSRKWCYGFFLTHQQGQSGFEFLFKTKELKKKWLDQFEMAVSNIRPENATFNSHHFKMHTFERATTCSSCHMLLRGIFNQGYLCTKCGNGAHKGCLGRLGVCGRAGAAVQKTQRKTTPRKQEDPGLPKMLVIRDYFGVPSPQGGLPLNAQIGDVIEVICADPHSSWWQHSRGSYGYRRVPLAPLRVVCRRAVRLQRNQPPRAPPPLVHCKLRSLWIGLLFLLIREPSISFRAPAEGQMSNAALERGLLCSGNESDAELPTVMVPRTIDYSGQPWFAGPIERHHAESELMERENSTYLVRYRSRESREYAISIKYNNDVKHIKILTKEGCFYIAESRTFKTVLELVEYYKQHSLKEGFRTLDTTLQMPYKELSSGLRTAVLTPRVLGIALARYDFSSRDTRELSLQVGDLVKIYIKCTNGWWKGEVNGRVRENTLIRLYLLKGVARREKSPELAVFFPSIRRPLRGAFSSPCAIIDDFIRPSDSAKFGWGEMERGAVTKPSSLPSPLQP
ncbi:Guanine nucleotide exchange factor VAV3 [Anabarilius grahami]|uniref:Guanine nucleotide exchange factor VAV3 n=1 Tax=Anabarilius grahami TaxID=495550 RepID=A0A3N0YEU1_ANAGA|nr:Guanine nucleotide exchange factor VAV3 [Anabarilius grahami]